MTLLIEDVLKSFQERVEIALKRKIELLGEKNHLREACGFALLNGGKRLRPLITLMVAEALGKNQDVMDAALACEMFHCASLVADDLPCMDNDATRRGKPSTHVVYGEALSLLVTYGLISAGYGCLAENVTKMKQGVFAERADHVGMLSLENVTYNTGLMGATGGQFLDIAPPDLTLATIDRVIHQKTVSLFEISFVNGWLFGGGDLDKIDLIKKLASHFGRAFQIVDDIDDGDQDGGQGVNIAVLLGAEKASKMALEELDQYQKLLVKLNIDTSLGKLPQILNLH